MDVGEAEIAPSMTISESFMVEAEEMKDRGMEVVNVNGIIGGFVAKFVARAMNGSRPHSAAGHP